MESQEPRPRPERPSWPLFGQFALWHLVLWWMALGEQAQAGVSFSLKLGLGHGNSGEREMYLHTNQHNLVGRFSLVYPFCNPHKGSKVVGGWLNGGTRENSFSSLIGMNGTGFLLGCIKKPGLPACHLGNPGAWPRCWYSHVNPGVVPGCWLLTSYKGGSSTAAAASQTTWHTTPITFITSQSYGLCLLGVLGLRGLEFHLGWLGFRCLVVNTCYMNVSFPRKCTLACFLPFWVPCFSGEQIPKFGRNFQHTFVAFGLSIIFDFETLAVDKMVVTDFGDFIPHGGGMFFGDTNAGDGFMLAGFHFWTREIVQPELFLFAQMAFWPECALHPPSSSLHHDGNESKKTNFSKLFSDFTRVLLDKLMSTCFGVSSKFSRLPISPCFSQDKLMKTKVGLDFMSGEMENQGNVDTRHFVCFQNPENTSTFSFVEVASHNCPHTPFFCTNKGEKFPAFIFHKLSSQIPLHITTKGLMPLFGNFGRGLSPNMISFEFAKERGQLGLPLSHFLKRKDGNLFSHNKKFTISHDAFWEKIFGGLHIQSTLTLALSIPQGKPTILNIYEGFTHLQISLVSTAFAHISRVSSIFGHWETPFTYANFTQVLHVFVYQENLETFQMSVVFTRILHILRKLQGQPISFACISHIFRNLGAYHTNVIVGSTPMLHISAGLIDQPTPLTKDNLTHISCIFRKWRYHPTPLWVGNLRRIFHILRKLVIQPTPLVLDNFMPISHIFWGVEYFCDPVMPNNFVPIFEIFSHMEHLGTPRVMGQNTPIYAFFPW